MLLDTKDAGDDEEEEEEEEVAPAVLTASGRGLGAL